MKNSSSLSQEQVTLFSYPLCIFHSNRWLHLHGHTSGVLTFQICLFQVWKFYYSEHSGTKLCLALQTSLLLGVTKDCGGRKGGAMLGVHELSSCLHWSYHSSSHLSCFPGTGMVSRATSVLLYLSSLFGAQKLKWLCHVQTFRICCIHTVGSVKHVWISPILFWATWVLWRLKAVGSFQSRAQEWGITQYEASGSSGWLRAGALG